MALYQADVTDRPAIGLLETAATPFTRELVEGVTRDRTSLDTLIERHSRDWTLDRIAPLERAILRVALFELTRREDVPDEVAINEAIEAAKELCGVDAPGFVNGILGAVKREEVGAP